MKGSNLMSQKPQPSCLALKSIPSTESGASVQRPPIVAAAAPPKGRAPLTSSATEIDADDGSLPLRERFMALVASLPVSSGGGSSNQMSRSGAGNRGGADDGGSPLLSDCARKWWRVLHDREEFIWYSEQDNWAHLYLHDLNTGELKRQLTSGNWPVLEVQQVDEESGTLYFTAAGREGGDPYYHYLYSLDLAGGEPLLLTPEPAHHQIDWSESAEYFVDTFSTPATPPVSVIRDRSGAVTLELERADASALVATGWQAPESFVVKARDQQTDLYGLLYRPSQFDPERRYPILNYLYPGPQSGSVGSRGFQPARRDKQAVAELGFIVVEVDAMGTPGRSKVFHDAYYGNMGDNGLPDQMSTIRQLAADRPWMDLDRVGVWGHSGGGFASAGAILRYPDFYKVAVSSAGNHDNRNYEDDWGEKWHGLLETYAEPISGSSDTEEQSVPRTNYDSQANQLFAENLTGKLLLAHGLLDDNVPPSNTLLLVHALIEAEKDFDLLLLPEARHGFGNSRYFMRKRWNYFVEHLQGVEPPSQFQFADNIN
mgnify:CR=1 FL=1